MNGYAVTASEKYAEESSRPVTKRPGFLARWFLKKLMEGAEWEKRQNQERDSIKSVNRLSSNLAVERSIDQPDRALHFTVYVANGGRVVETRRYDKKTDRNNNGLYVITNDADFGKEIDKIITMESLRG
jgi:hypothetical protein